MIRNLPVKLWPESHRIRFALAQVCSLCVACSMLRVFCSMKLISKRLTFYVFLITAFHGQARRPEPGAEAAMVRLHVVTSLPPTSASSSNRAHLNRMHVKKAHSPRSGSRSASGSRSSSHGSHRNAPGPQRNELKK